MSTTNIQQLHPLKQAAKDGVFSLKGMARTKLIHNVIREYGKYHDNNYAVNLNDIDPHDKKLLLSYVLDSEELREVIDSPTMLHAYMLEHADYLNDLINYECYEVYQEDMEEAREYK